MLAWPETYRVLDEITDTRLRRVSVPGPAFRVLGTIGDWVKRVYDFEFPLTRDAMEYATQWPGCSGDQTTRELGVEWRDARETYTDTIRWLYRAGHLTEKHVGLLAND